MQLKGRGHERTMWSMANGNAALIKLSSLSLLSVKQTVIYIYGQLLAFIHILGTENLTLE